MGNESQKAFHQPDGRILGKMAYSDCISAHVLQNIPGDKDQKIFASGVRYFRKISNKREGLKPSPTIKNFAFEHIENKYLAIYT